MDFSKDLPFSDIAVKNKTGRNWQEWCALLDSEGADKLTHQQIVGIVHDKYEGGRWWSQMLTVGYERLRGLRTEGQSRDGSFNASASKTLAVDAATAHSFFCSDEKRRLWLDAEIVVKTATSPKSVRMSWLDGTPVNVWITAKGDAKCSVALEHCGLPTKEAAIEAKEFWKGALENVVRLAT